MEYQIHETAWVSEDGSWSQGTPILTFPASALTPIHWQILDELPDSQKMYFVEAILNGDDINQWWQNEHNN
jgi:hypothetical protein